jgi:hypothetical protein
MQLPFWADVAVERHTRHPQFGTQLADFRFLLTVLKDSSIVHWHHLNLHGEYDFSEEKL